MREEVMMILKMLEEGKITTEQAASLIEAVNEAVGLDPSGGDSEIPDSGTKRSTETEPGPSSGRLDMSGVQGLVDKVSQLADVVDTTAVESLAEKIRDTVESAIKRTDRAVNRLQQEVRERCRSAESDSDDTQPARWSKAIVEPLQSMFSHGIRVEKVMDGSFPDDPGKEISVELGTWNGSITVEPWDNPGFRVDVTATMKGQGVECESAGNILEELLKCDSTEDSLKIKVGHGKALTGASLKVRLPRKLKYDLELKTDNGAVSVRGFECKMIRAETSNGRIQLDDTRGVITELETSNGRINVSGVSRRLSAKTSNGGITILSQGIAGESEYELKTSNGAIEVQLAGDDKVGYHIDAKTSLGRIVLDLPDLVYQATDERTVRRDVIAETIGFSENADRLKIKARTSNGQVRIIYG